MTKNEFLMTVAIECVESGKSIEFDLKEILSESNHFGELKKHYGVGEPKEDQKAWEEAIFTVLTDVLQLMNVVKSEFMEKPSNGWYFMRCPNEKTICIVKAFEWEKEQYLSDRCVNNELRSQGIPMHGFVETCESEFEYEGHYEEGIAHLLKYGFKEVPNPFDYEDDE